MTPLDASAPLLALLAGAASFLSPCVLPLVPPYLCYIAGTTSTQDLAIKPKDAAKRACLFVIGFAAVFIILGLAASAVGSLLLKHQALLEKLAGAAIVVMGLHLLGALRIAPLNRVMRITPLALAAPNQNQHSSGNQNPSGGGATAALILGIAFGFGWTPCVGPVLASILALAAAEASLIQGAALLAIYALGLGIPFVLAALAADKFLKASSKLSPHLRKIERVSGGVLVGVGALIAFGRFADIAYALLETFPALAALG